MLVPGVELTNMVLWSFPSSVTRAFTAVSWLFVDTSCPGSSASGAFDFFPPHTMNYTVHTHAVRHRSLQRRCSPWDTGSYSHR